MAVDRTVKLGEWEFQMTQQPWGLYISVPDCGGMADSLPRVPEQLNWAELAFGALPGLKQVWPTTWELSSPDALPELEALFQRSGGLWRGAPLQGVTATPPFVTRVRIHRA